MAKSQKKKGCLTGERSNVASEEANEYQLSSVSSLNFLFVFLKTTIFYAQRTFHVTNCFSALVFPTQFSDCISTKQPLYDQRSQQLKTSIFLRNFCVFKDSELCEKGKNIVVAIFAN